MRRLEIGTHSTPPNTMAWTRPNQNCADSIFVRRIASSARRTAKPLLGTVFEDTNQLILVRNSTAEMGLGRYIQGTHYQPPTMGSCDQGYAQGWLILLNEIATGKLEITRQSRQNPSLRLKYKCWRQFLQTLGQWHRRYQYHPIRNKRRRRTHTN